jgi:hypothetical protein
MLDDDTAHPAGRLAAPGGIGHTRRENRTRLRPCCMRVDQALERARSESGASLDSTTRPGVQPGRWPEEHGRFPSCGS